MGSSANLPFGSNFRRIGNIEDFGVTPTTKVAGLAFIGETLYMAGRENNALYTIDISNGRATRVGSSNNFGITQADAGGLNVLLYAAPGGLAAIGNTLYMAGVNSHSLYRMNTTTGVVTLIGELGVNHPLSIAAIGNTLYLVGSPRRLYTVNLNTGAATRVSQNNLIEQGQVHSLAAIGNTLYLIAVHNNINRLYTVNTTTGIASSVFAINLSSSAFTTKGNILYVGDRNSNAIYVSIEPIKATFSGHTGTKTGDFSIRLTFGGTEAVTGLDKTDIAFTHVSGTSLALSGMSDYTITAVQGNNRAFDLNFTPATRVMGVYQLAVDSGSEVTVGSEKRSISATSVQFTVDTSPAVITAEFSGHTGIKTTAYSIVVDFDGTTAVSGFTNADTLLTRSSGTSLSGSGLSDYTIARSSTDPSRYVISFTPAANILGTYTLSLKGEVTVSGDARTIMAPAATMNVDTRPPPTTPHSATFLGFSGTKTGDFSIGVDFAGSDAVTNFELTDVNLTHVSGTGLTASGLGDFGITSNVGNNFNINFTPATNVSGVYQLDITGMITSGGASREVTITPVNFTVDTVPTPPTPIKATFSGFTGVKGNLFHVDVLFEGTDAVTDLTINDFNLSSVSGNVAVGSGFGSFSIAAIANSNDYRLNFNVRDNVTGIYRISLDGQVTSDGKSREVTITPADISIDTTPETVEPADAAFVTIGYPEQPIGTFADIPVTKQIFFDITWSEGYPGFNANNIAIYETGHEGANPLSSALTNIGTVGTSTHWRLSYTPPTNMKGEVIIAVFADVFKSNPEALSPSVRFDTTTPDPPEVIPVSVTIEPAESPVGTLAQEPAANASVLNWNIIFSEDIGDGTFKPASHIEIWETTAAGGTNPLPANLSNVGTTGTFTHFRLKHTLPDSGMGEIYIKVVADIFKNNAEAVSAPVSYGIPAPIDIPTIPAVVLILPAERPIGTLSKLPIPNNTEFWWEIIWSVNPGSAFSAASSIELWDSANAGGQNPLNTNLAVIADSDNLRYRLKHTTPMSGSGEIYIRVVADVFQDNISATSAVVSYGPVTADDVDIPTVAISYPERPVGKFAALPFSQAVTYDITWSEDFEAFDASSHITINETGAGPYNPLDNTLANVGSAGTFTHWRLTYTPPANKEGDIIVGVLPNVYKGNAESFSPIAQFDTLMDTPTLLFTIGNEIVVRSGETFNFPITTNVLSNISIVGTPPTGVTLSGRTLTVVGQDVMDTTRTEVTLRAAFTGYAPATQTITIWTLPVTELVDAIHIVDVNFDQDRYNPGDTIEATIELGQDVPVTGDNAAELTDFDLSFGTLTTIEAVDDMGMAVASGVTKYLKLTITTAASDDGVLTIRWAT